MFDEQLENFHAHVERAIFVLEGVGPQTFEGVV